MHQSKKVLCFGELLLRISPLLTGSIEESSVPIYIGGAELNAARALAKWGVPVRYCSALPAHFLSDNITTQLQSEGIDTTGIKVCGDRIGLYFMPHGADLKHASVIYDRSNSSFAILKRGMIDWDAVFDGVDCFHFSAIVPAISEALADLCEEALQAAVVRNIRTSIDLNYRAKLWKYGKTPNEVLPRLVRYCDVVMGNLWADEIMLDVPVDNKLVAQDTQEAYLEQSATSSIAIQTLFPKVEMVAHTFRFTGDDSGLVNYYGTLYVDGKLYTSATHTSAAIVDKAGTGDCFMAGLIYAYKHQFNYQSTIEFAAGAAFSKFFVKGDATATSVEEIDNIIQR